MAANTTGEYKVFRYYEGLCSSGDFPKEIAKVLALGVKTPGLKDIFGTVIEEPTVLRNKNWDIVYPTPDSSLNLDLNELTTSEYIRKIENQIQKISDTVILKTTTTPRELDSDEIDDLTTDNDANKTSLTMYLEIYHPTYIANPEEYPLDCERKGITPKLITKEMYQKPYQSVQSVEEYIYQNGICTPATKDDTTVGSVDLRYETCDNYVAKINDALGNTSFSLPSVDYVPTRTVISSAYLAKIKQNDADLYELILNTLGSDGIGMEPKDYILLDSLTIEITRENSIYTVVMEGTKKLTEYTIKAGSYYTVAHVPATSLVPEFYLDGVYIPLEITKFHTDEKTIYFDEDIVFETTTDGVLVVRYDYEYSGSSVVTDRTTFLNNHYVLLRMFDHLNAESNGPAENLYNSNGEVIQINSHVSPWSKLSWYQDFEEVMVDTIDSDIGVTNIHDGVVYVPLETPGLSADTKIRYWINTNNDRFSIIVMGNPSMDYERDRHLISACYCGQIDSFENSINDTAGNFALFTSSSTEPCNTTLTTEQMTHEPQPFSLTDEDVASAKYAKIDIDNFIKNAVNEGCMWTTPITNGQSKYYVQLSDKKYFNRKVWPRYLILDDNGMPANNKGIQPAFRRNYIMNGGKSDFMEITLNNEDIGNADGFTLCVIFSYFEEKYVITSGVTRDIFGNIVNVEKTKDYGANTSDGVTSISMYHTRSKAYYQKHHMLFATTEEYMSKVMYGKSSYTGEYYADRIKVTHGNDGPRGTLSDLLVIDSSSLYALDELVINKDFEKDPEQYEETFVYFPITAPFSPLSDSPNARYGFAIKKEEIEPKYEDEEKILKIAVNQLGTIAANWWPVSADLDGMQSHPPAPPSQTANGCSVYWQVLDDTAWYDVEGAKATNPEDRYVPVRLAVKNTSGKYDGDVDGQTIMEFTSSGAKKVFLTQGDTKGNILQSYVKISGNFLDGNDDFDPKDELIAGRNETTGEGYFLAYGTSEKSRLQFNEGARVRVVLNDGMSGDKNETFEYNIEGIPYTGLIDSTHLATDPDDCTECKIIDATPSQYLYLYLVKASRQRTLAMEEKETRGEELTLPELMSCELIYEVIRFACVPMWDDTKSKNELLQYPCNVNILTKSGKGKYTILAENGVNGEGATQYTVVATEADYMNTTTTFNSALKIYFVPDDDYHAERVEVYDADAVIEEGSEDSDGEVIRTFTATASNESDKIKQEMYKGANLSYILFDDITRNVRVKVTYAKDSD